MKRKFNSPSSEGMNKKQSLDDNIINKFATFNNLPEEIYLSIFEFLMPKDLLNVKLVNKQFHDIANEDYLWETFCKNILKMETKLFQTWEEQFKMCRNEIYQITKCGEDGKLFACGSNFDGELSFGLSDNLVNPQKVSIMETIVKLSAGSNHTLILMDDYQIAASGYNEFGQLGLNDNDDRFEFEWIRALDLEKIIEIACGTFHSCALTEDGYIFSWGYNASGQLGHDDKKDKNVPTLIETVDNIKKIICGGHRTMAINENDELYVWGNNEYGELGLGDFIDREKPELNSFFKDKKIKKVEAGDEHTLFLLENGEIYSCGQNNYGQLGHGDTNNRNIPTLISFFKGMNVINIFAFSNHSFVVLENNLIYAFGSNSAGELAIEGDGKKPEKIKFFQNEKILNIVGGDNHTLFITESGAIYGVGYNASGQLGIGSTNDVVVPTLMKFK